MTREQINEALHLACESGNTESVRLSLKHGADVNARDKYDNLPLHWACIRGHTPIVRLLLEKGAEVESKDKWNYTPLHVACLNGRPTVVRVLVDHGADVNARDDYGRGPLDMVLQSFPTGSAREEILDLFRQYAPEMVMEAYCTQPAGPGS